jgi:hypothetical protein
MKLQDMFGQVERQYWRLWQSINKGRLTVKFSMRPTELEKVGYHVRKCERPEAKLGNKT